MNSTSIKRNIKSTWKAKWNNIKEMFLEGMKYDNKPFSQFVKSQQNLNIGDAPLQNNEGNLAGDCKEILNRQF